MVDLRRRNSAFPASREYYIEPAGANLGRGLEGLGAIVGRQLEAQRAEEEADELAAQQAEARAMAQAEIQEAIRSGDPLRIADVSIKYPALRENIESAMSIGGDIRDQQLEEEKIFLQGAIVNPEGALESALTRRDALQRMGRDTTQVEETIENLQNPELRDEELKSLEMMYSIQFPEEAKAFQELMNPPEDYNKPFLSDGKPNPAYQEYQERLRAAGRSETNINLPASVGKATETFGEGIGDRANERITQAASAQSQNMQLERMAQGLAEGAATGLGQESLLMLKNLGQSLFGIPISEEATEQEVIQTLSNRLALEIRNPTSGLGLPGSTSNRDLQFLINSVPGLQRTPEGNALLIEYFMKINDMKQDVAREQQRIIDENEGTVPSNLDSQLMQFINAYEILDGDDQALVEDLLEVTPAPTGSSREVGRFTVIEN